MLGSVKGIDNSQLEPAKLCLRDIGNLSLIWGILGTFAGARGRKAQCSDSCAIPDRLMPIIELTKIKSRLMCKSSRQ